MEKEESKPKKKMLMKIKIKKIGQEDEATDQLSKVRVLNEQ
jgi:hypothetical protein